MNPPPPTSRKRRLGSERSSAAPMSSRTERSTFTSTPSTDKTGASGRSTLHNRNFEQKLIDNRVYPENHRYADGTRHPQPENFDTLLERLQKPRASLSPSRFTTDDFLDFKDANTRAAGESATVYSIGPIIGGATDKKCGTEMNIPFNNLHPFDKDIGAPKPGSFDGMAPESVPLQIRKDLDKSILPSTDDSLPAAPNFFSEWKGRRGRVDVALVQACHDGAVGAHGMHQLKNYGKTEEQYYNNADSFSSTYHPVTATLQVYSHHMTAPKTPGGKPEFHMTQLNSYAMTGNVRNFREGATAYRNMRDFAAEKRIDAVGEATRMAEQHIIDGSSDTSTDELALRLDLRKRRRKDVLPDGHSLTQRRSRQLMSPASSGGNGPREQSKAANRMTMDDHVQRAPNQPQPHRKTSGAQRERELMQEVG